MAKRSTSKSGASFSGDERIVVLYGKDNFQRGERMRQLREALEQSHEAVETLRFDDSAQLADVLDELRSYGLMQQHKMVVVDEADKFITQYREQLERYAADPAQNGTLVLRPGAWTTTTKLHKAIEGKIGRAIKCEPPTRPEAERWVVQRAEHEHGVKLPMRAAVLLVEHIGADLGRLDTELGKLAVTVEPGGAIAVEQIEAMVGHASDEMAWSMQEAMLTGDAGAALAKLHELVDLAGHHEVLITFAVSDLMRKVAHAAAMQSAKANDFTIAKELKIWPQSRQKPLLDAARKLGRDGSAALLGRLVDQIRRSRSGYGDATTNLEGFCVQFADAIR